MYVMDIKKKTEARERENENEMKRERKRDGVTVEITQREMGASEKKSTL